MWIYILAISFVIKNGGTSSLQGTFQTAFDGCYGIQGWSLVTEDNVRNSFKSGSSWTDSRLYQSKTFNLSIVVEKRLKIQSASALCEEGDRSSIEYYLSSTRTCRNKTHLSTLNMDQVNDLIKRRSIHSGSNYIIENFNISDRPMFNFLCGFWRSETKEFVWENCSLSRPFVCFVGLPKYTILRASYTSKDPPWRNIDSGRRPSSETDSALSSGGRIPVPVAVVGGFLAICFIMCVIRIIRKKFEEKKLRLRNNRPTTEQTSEIQAQQHRSNSEDRESVNSSSTIYCDVIYRNTGNQNSAFSEEDIYENT